MRGISSSIGGGFGAGRRAAPIAGLTYNGGFDSTLIDILGTTTATLTRASSAANPDTGQIVGNNAPRYVSGRLGNALYVEEGTTNVFLNSTGVAAVTQNITLSTANSGKWTCSVRGSGSVTITAGTGTATGLGAVTAGSPRTITVTVNGTFTFTVAGADATTSVQVENKPYPTSHIPAAGASATRAGEVVRVPTAGKFTLAGSTVSAWVRVDANGPWCDTVSNCAVFDHSSTGTDNTNRFHITKVGGTIACAVFNSSGVSTGITLNMTLSVGWHHIAFTWKASEVALYIDGGKHTAAGGILPSALGTYMQVGSRYDNSMNFADAAIDCLRIYNRVLSATEISQIFNSRS